MDQPRCPNCKRIITCGCQYDTASDGSRLCTVCKPFYEEGLKVAHNNPKNTWPNNNPLVSNEKSD